MLGDKTAVACFHRPAILHRIDVPGFGGNERFQRHHGVFAKALPVKAVGIIGQFTRRFVVQFEADAVPYQVFDGGIVAFARFFFDKSTNIRYFDTASDFADGQV